MMRILLITALFLSSTSAEAQRGDHKRNNNLPCVTNCNPFSGATSLDILLTRDTFGQIHPTVPYWELWQWASEVGQTAQQMAGICSVLEQEVNLPCLPSGTNP